MLPILVLLLSAAYSPVASPVLACSAVPRAEIERAVGRSLQPGSEVTSAGDSSCSYSAGGVTVSIEIQRLDAPLDLPTELEQLRATFPGARLRRVPGVGAMAFAMEIPGAGTQVHVLPSEREYGLVSVLGLEDGHAGADAATGIAQAVLSHRSARPAGKEVQGRS